MFYEFGIKLSCRIVSAEADDVPAEGGGGFAVGHEDQSAAGCAFGKTPQKNLLSLRVKGGGRFVKKKDSALAQKRAGNTDPLGLAFTEPGTFLATQSI